MIKMTTKILGVKELDKGFQEVRTQLGLLGVPLKGALDVVRDSLNLQFWTEGRHIATRWNALAPSTVKQRRKLGYGGMHPILVRTGTLKKSFIGPGGGIHLEMVGDTHAVIGSQYFLAEIHQYGTGKIPARPIIDEKRPVTEEEERRIRQIFDDFVNRWFRKI